MGDIDHITRELARVDAELRSLPDDAFEQRYHLRMEQDTLRQQAAQFAEDVDKDRSDQDLLAELSGLRSQLTQIERQKIDLVVQAGGGAVGTSNMTNLGGVDINRRIGEAAGAGRIQARIGRIKGILTDRGVKVPDPN